VTPNDVRRRLRSRADELDLDFQQAIQYYAVERFLYRLSTTELADALIVKGATMLRVWDGAVSRPTRDIDFLGRIDSSPEAVEVMLRACLDADVPDDGLRFDPEIGTESITLESRYPGIRAKIRGDLEGAQFVIRLDIGIDDATVPDPGWVEYPTLLGGPSPRILAYHPATAIAEKLETMVKLGAINSRMRDFYDVWMLATTQEFAGGDLRDALKATFQKRETPLPQRVPLALTNSFAEQDETARRWAILASALRSASIDVPETLPEVQGVIEALTMPPARAAANGDVFDLMWTPDGGWR
jgi:hypothetical protein